MSDPFKELTLLVSYLRSDEGCAWTREQTFKTIIPYTIEEAYEVAEAVDKEDYNELRDELGDLLFHIAFFAEIAKEEGLFSLNDAINNVIAKVKRRSPHLFGSGNAKTAKEIDAEWERIKALENKDLKRYRLEQVSKGLPALLHASKLCKKAAEIGFEWSKIDQCRAKVSEELEELNRAIQNNDSRNIEEEFGDVLMTVANWARFMGVNPEEALRKSNNKFIQRFNALEDIIDEEQIDFKVEALEKRIEIWQQAKAKLKKKQERIA